MSYDNLLPGHAYCITTVTAGRLPLFNSLTAARLVIGEMRRLHDAGALNSIAWVLMPDHLHWLIQLGEEESLGAVMQHFKGRSSRMLNNALNSQGSRWQRAYYDRALRKEEDLRQLARYMVANPLRARLVEQIGEYPHWDAVWL
ncbi:REP-associated tyrosine transposase [Marinobacterium arenosum]|uniref:REP-associated tyrosine transposase n=1 Tax=Marinobacterium arenosum TaxID=2862496 RepID=UPI001C96EE77|nr:transposase [Marinobacterium arenosum]MBY4678466.1 transposase [Marinobacterium arenosum]